MCAGLVVVASLRTALGLWKEEEEEERRKMNNSHGRRFCFAAQERLIASPKAFLESERPPDQS